MAPRLGATPSLVLLAALAAPIAGCSRTYTTDEPDHDAAAVTKPLAPTPTPAPARAASAGGEAWNPAIDWQSYDAAIANAKSANKPVCLVFTTTWCPHCKNYSHVFDDPRVVERAKEFEMVHLDSEADAALSAKYAVDGAYIPRTYFLAPDGTLDPTIHPPRTQSKYFYDERDPSSLLAGMSAALQKLAH